VAVKVDKAVMPGATAFKDTETLAVGWAASAVYLQVGVCQ